MAELSASLKIRGLAPRALIDRLMQLGNKMPVIAAELATVTMVELDRTWSARQTPSGQPWRPTKCRDNPILELTGAMRGSLSVEPKPRSFTVRITDWKASIHQRGVTITPKRAEFLRWKDSCGWHRAKRVRIPARPMLPTKGIPATWRKAYKLAVIKWLKKEIG